jgi:hypothetical protein
VTVVLRDQTGAPLALSSAVDPEWLAEQDGHSRVTVSTPHYMPSHPPGRPVWPCRAGRPLFRPLERPTPAEERIGAIAARVAGLGLMGLAVVVTLGLGWLVVMAITR